MRWAPPLVVALLLARSAGAAPCRSLTVSYTADCLRVAGDDGCGWHAARPDLGPQVAVWIETADRAQFIDTVSVTNATALFGIGNRPGVWNLPTGPRFPYGRRPMSLPIWAHARGRTYPLVVMQDGEEGRLMSHEEESSPEPHFCKPPLAYEIVDAVTCASGRFRSDKGRLDPTQRSFYPPRADLLDLGQTCPMPARDTQGGCDPGDSAQYGFLNDVDVVASATPAFGVVSRSTWTIPDTLPAGAYAVMVEVSKELDENASYAAPNAPELDGDDYGISGNLGQPSVVYRVPFTLGAEGAPAEAATGDLYGYGDWTGTTGTIFPPDGTISDEPGSGAGRLVTTDGPGGVGRVHVALSACGPVDCTALPAPAPVPIAIDASTETATTATVEIDQVGDGGEAPVRGYDVRYAQVPPGALPLTSDLFARWTPAPTPAPTPPGSIGTAQLTGLTPETYYVAGVVAHGRCGDSPVSYVRFVTPAIKYQQLHGCFIATAAFGSPLAAEVTRFRRVRDRAVAASGLARLAAELYYREAPALAQVLAGTDVGRAVVRQPLRALAGLVDAFPSDGTGAAGEAQASAAGSTASTVVPAAGLDARRKVPPQTRTRSRMPTTPR
jgi:hypothetical protein